MRIVGVSFNAPSRNASWVAKQSYPYEVWSDADRTLAMRFGAASGAGAITPKRITVVLNGSGEVVLRYPDVQVGAHPEEVLEDCRALFERP